MLYTVDATFNNVHMYVCTYTIQESEKNCACKAPDQPLLCSGGAVRHLHHRHCPNWSSCALWSGLCTHALLLPGRVLLDGS